MLNNWSDETRAMIFSHNDPGGGASIEINTTFTS